ncbi:gamma-glutamyltranspeptidase 1-like protein [Martensiomyces pterosporus]|nr:gamma-glutamyltranspeptidase 1-like protein [Martensiomyces pterosporus]
MQLSLTVACLYLILMVAGIDPVEHSTLVVAKRGAVATDEPRCSAIGLDVLREGGNAVDAAVASTLCIGILQAHSSGIGGGGFMLVRLPGDKKPVLIDFRETAGGAATEDMYINNITLAQIGGLAVGVPGEIAGLHSAHKRFGKLPWHRLFEPSIKLARKGFALSSLVHTQLKSMEAHIISSPGFNTTYTDGKGHLLSPGDIVRRPELAHTLEEIARHGPQAFYSGEIARSLVKAVQDNGGILTTDDFAQYKAIDHEPIETFYHGRRVITGSPPTSGSVLLNMLNVLEGYTLAAGGQTALSYHRIVEAMKFGAAQRTALGDPRFVDLAANISRQISKHYAGQIRANISDTQTFGVMHYDPEYDILNNHGTTHLSVLDSDEMAVAVTSTVNLEFGSRIMDPVTGVILNDEMDDFSTTNKTNGFGLRPSPFNKIVPGKRPLSSTSATIVERDGHVELVVGGSGGSRILTAVLQVIINLFDFGMRLDHAIDMPRLHHQLLPDQLSVDPLFPISIAHSLASFGHTIAPLKHGSSVVQAVHKQPDGTIYAVSDARKHGLAAGF